MTDVRENDDELECAVCQLTPYLPTKLPCGHIFCFLCVKGVAFHRPNCPMCRESFHKEILQNPTIIKQTMDENDSLISSINTKWYYQAGNSPNHETPGWWLYDARTTELIETAFHESFASDNSSHATTIWIGGRKYVVDFELMVQYQADRVRTRTVTGPHGTNQITIPNRVRNICRVIKDSESETLLTVVGEAGVPLEILNSQSQ